jgi:REP element-mobilizing transposase RayT
MQYDPEKHHRRSVRLKGYDYAQAGAYFVTICTHDHFLFFEDETTRTVAEQCWLEIPQHFPYVELDEWVVMPNHVHGILIITSEGGGVQWNAPTAVASADQGVQLNAPTSISPHRGTLAVIIRTYKAAVTTLCKRSGQDGFAWQRGFYEHIIRNERELNAIRQYIANNPAQWEVDRENPQHRW